MIVVVATNEDELAGAQADLASLGLTGMNVAAPSEERRLVLAPVEDEREGAQLVSRLRAMGRLAVVRPNRGVQLENWTRHSAPFTVADRLSVCFAWSEHERRGLPNLVELDPAGGFGGGAHPTTRLLLEELAARISGGERVLDVGSGSGILGICALQLGAQRVTAVDVDARAVECTRRNAALNGVGDRLEASLVPLGSVAGSFDVVLANIGRSALVELGEGMVARTSSNGWIGVSGFPSSQCETVMGALAPMRLLALTQADEWAALVVHHPAAETTAGLERP